MRRARQKRSAVPIGIAALVVAVVFTYLVFRNWEIPFVGHYEVKAEFRDSSTLQKGSVVRVAGVNVGKVTKVEHRSPGSRVAVATMRIEGGRPIHRDARAAIRMRTSLEGNQFVDLSPGTSAASEMPDGGTIKASATSAPVQLDQVLGALDEATRRALVRTVDQLGRGISGRGGDGFNRSIAHWKPAYRWGSVVGDASLGQRPHDLSGWLTAAGVVADALDRDPPAVRRLITRFDDTAAAFAAERDALGETVSELPETLSTGERTLRDVEAALPEVEDVAAAARPAVRAGVPTIDASLPLFEQMRRLVRASELGGLARDLAPASSALAQLTARLVPLMEQVRPASSCMDLIINPWLKTTIPDPVFKPAGPVFEESIKGPLPGLAGESRSGDANGQWFAPLVVGGTNVIALGDDKFAATAFPAIGVNPQMTEQRPPLRPGVPCETQKKTDLASIPADPPRQFRVSFDTPEAKERLAKARAKTIDWLRGQLKVQGLDGVLKVADEDLTRGVLSKLPPTSPDMLDGLARKASK